MLFEYKGKTTEGKKAKGKLEADSRREALMELSEMGVVPFTLKEISALNKDIRFKKRLKNADFVMFLRQYATLINSHVSVSESTKTMSKQVSNIRLKEALEDVDLQVERGEPLSTALTRHPKLFPDLLVNMVYAGETSGRLDEILESMATYYEKDHNNKRKMISAMMYPSVVGLLAVALTVFLLVFIIPSFAETFKSMDAELPAYTQLILNLSNGLQQYWYMALIGVVGLVFGLILFFKIPAVKFKMDGWKLKMPLLGPLFHKSVLVRTTQTMSLLLDANVPILQTLAITEKVVPNLVVKRTLIDMRDILRSGGEMSKPMEAHWIYPAIVSQMVMIGEKTGAVDSMLAKVSSFYEEEVNQLIDRFGSLIEPIMIVGLTGIVGSLVMAIIIPMFSMYENF